MENSIDHKADEANSQSAGDQNAIGSNANTGLKRGIDHVKDREAAIREQSKKEAAASAPVLTGNSDTASPDAAQRMTENISRENKPYRGTNDPGSNHTPHPGE